MQQQDSVERPTKVSETLVDEFEPPSSETASGPPTNPVIPLAETNAADRSNSSRALSKTYKKRVVDSLFGKADKNIPAINPISRAFMNRYYPGVGPAEWNDWTWQFRNRIGSLGELARMIKLSADEIAPFEGQDRKLPLSITPYYMSLVHPKNPLQPLRRSVIPTGFETTSSPGEADDPLGEDHDTAVPGLVHRYPDRVLLLVTGVCSTYCRYCTRSRMVAGRRDDCSFDRRRLEKAFDYIKANPAVRDVLISGGDPLTLPDDKLDWILKHIRRIKHVEMVRIGTKAPVVLPMRITPALTDMLRRHHPLFMSLHFTHPDELTPETKLACTRLADAGIPLGSQTVLLKGVNDQVETLKKLFQGLLRNRVKPYYLYQCDPITGSAHFRTTVSRGLEIIQGLRGHTTGYAIPTYVIDAPGGGGKVALYPDAVVGRRGDDLLLKNYEGLTFTYPDNGGGRGRAVN
ncbi:MAG: KamA family radical SAM protein [Pseudomonadota bacterium]